MRIAQIVLAGATEFERKLQRVDFAALSLHHEVTVADTPEAANSASVAHVYGPSPIPQRALAGLKVPYVASADVHRTRFMFRPIEPPRYVLSPLAPADPQSRTQLVPEAVEESYFDIRAARVATDASRIVGTYRGSRPGVGNAVEQAISRIQRFREDITWTLFDQPPSPHDLAGVDAWADPAATEDDWDGFVAEAVAAGKPVVATRITMNGVRLEKGRTGSLVPLSDPNELAHAILGVLFKPEVARLKIEAAKQTAGKFRPRQRLRVLERIYEAVTE